MQRLNLKLINIGAISAELTQTTKSTNGNHSGELTKSHGHATRWVSFRIANVVKSHIVKGIWVMSLHVQRGDIDRVNHNCETKRRECGQPANYFLHHSILFISMPSSTGIKIYERVPSLTARSFLVFGLGPKNSDHGMTSVAPTFSALMFGLNFSKRGLNIARQAPLIFFLPQEPIRQGLNH